MRLTIVMITGALAIAGCATPPKSPHAGMPPGSSTGMMAPGGVAQPGASGGIRLSDARGRGGMVQATGPRVTPPPTAQADAFARSFLNSIQGRSFAEHRELCGYFIVTPSGQIAATPPVGGTMASCSQAAPGPDAFASYHTHGGYDAGYDNEVPSAVDLMSDIQFGMDGYVSTPGGRVWRIELDDRTVVQICGQGCIAVDPAFIPEGEGGIRARYTLAGLNAR